MAKSSKLKKLKKIKRNLSAWRIRGSYYRNYKRASLKDHYILVESKNGDDIAGNMFSILSELTNQEYQSFHIFLAAKLEKMEQFQELLANNGITNVKIIESGTRKYYKLLATAKYIFLDTSLNRDYMKKDGQIITNTWHGTPLKLMGMQVKDRAYAMGNVQRNLQMADYLVYPNRLMKDIMFKAYCLDNLYQGTVLMSGYPRNSIFFDQKAADSVRKEIGYEDKKLYVYMPTWRGSLNKLDVTKQVDEMEYLLRELDATMSDDVTILAKLHPFVGDAIDFSGFHHIHAFPKNMDSYSVLNAADGLVTDYSSVFFDFVNTRKKIIIWAYDKYAYLGERGTYVALEDMPFPVVASPKELAEEMQKGKSYDESDFIEKNGFCDCPEATRNLCHHVLLNENCCNALSYHWFANNEQDSAQQLRPWLDPLRSGALYMDGSYLRSSAQPAVTESEPAVRIYPNPALDELSVRLLTDDIRTAEIFSASGQRIRSVSLQQGENRIPLQNMAEGIYLLRVAGERQCHFVKFTVIHP